MPLARLGLGSNLGDSAALIRRALAGLAEFGRVTECSSLYRTSAWGERDQPDFLNAAALFETGLSPRALLVAVQALERRLGRRPSYRWGPRAIDVDILAYDDVRVDEPDLVIPHPRLHERAFALVPLAEIDRAYAPALERLPAAERTAVQRIPAATTRKTQAVNWDETLERVRTAAAFCAEAGLTRFRVDDDELAIEVRRSLRAARFLPAAVAMENGTVSSADHSGSNGAAAPAPATVLRAEFVGIVRLSRPTVTAGSLLAEDRELAFVEALGIRNPVRSGGPGRIAGVFVADGQAVEYGQALFSIDA